MVEEAVIEPWIRDLIGDAKSPGRKIRPSGYSCTGFAAAGDKAPRSQATESTLEIDFLDLVRGDNRVERFLTQPFTIHWTDSLGKPRRYTPDVIVRYRAAALKKDPFLRTTIFEVKPREILQRDWLEFKPKFRAAIGWSRERGCRFKILTEQQIRIPLRESLRFLSRFSLKELSADRSGPDRCIALLEAVAALKTASPRQVLDYLTDDFAKQAALVPWLWHLVLEGRIGADLSKSLNMAARIWSLDSSEDGALG